MLYSRRKKMMTRIDYRQNKEEGEGKGRLNTGRRTRLSKKL